MGRQERERKYTATTNEQLAKKYFEVVARDNGNLDIFNVIKRTISRAGTNIASYYEKHGSLEGLNIKGIGPETKRVLYMILEGDLGGPVDNCAKIEEFSIPKPQKTSEIPADYGIKAWDNPNTWDNIVKACEGG
jgi:hypothetical protein